MLLLKARVQEWDVFVETRIIKYIFILLANHFRLGIEAVFFSYKSRICLCII